MSDKKPRITKEIRERFLRLASEAIPPRASEEVEQRRKELMGEVIRCANKTWPKNEMKILEKHGVASIRERIIVQLGGAGCSCDSIPLLAEGPLKRPLPYRGRYGSEPTLDAPEFSLLADLARAYNQSLDARNDESKALRRALSDLVNATLVSGKGFDRLDVLTKAWPDPKVKELVKNIKANELPMETKAAQVLVAKAYATKGGGA